MDRRGPQGCQLGRHAVVAIAALVLAGCQATGPQARHDGSSEAAQPLVPPEALAERLATASTVEAQPDPAIARIEARYDAALQALERRCPRESGRDVAADGLRRAACEYEAAAVEAWRLLAVARHRYLQAAAAAGVRRPASPPLVAELGLGRHATAASKPRRKASPPRRATTPRPAGRTRVVVRVYDRYAALALVGELAQARIDAQLVRQRDGRLLVDAGIHPRERAERIAERILAVTGRRAELRPLDR